MADTVLLANCLCGRKNANFTPVGALWENPKTDLSRKPRLLPVIMKRVTAHTASAYTLPYTILLRERGKVKLNSTKK